MEKWDVYDVNGIPTGKTKTRNDIFDVGEYHLGICAWIVNSKGELLIQKRSANKRIRPNIWGSTCGSVIAGETSIKGCIREIKEEIGIDIEEHELILLSRIFIRNRIFDDYLVIKNISIEETLIQPDEVCEIKWAAIDEIKQLFDYGLFMLGGIDDMKLVIEYIDKHICRLK